MMNDTRVCEHAEAYHKSITQIYSCNSEEECPDKIYISGLLDNHNKPLPLCKREMERHPENPKGLEENIGK